MSRIGKKPIEIPQGVEIKVDSNVVHVKGPKGTLDVNLPKGISGEVADGILTLGRADEERETRAFHGLGRALVFNAVAGVSTGWSKALDIIGIGYRAEKQAKSVVFSLGYSHTIDFPIPEGIEIEVDGKANRISVSGIDRQKVGQVAADIRSLRPPEPYKGKGIRYAGEYVKIKAGKQGATV